MCGICGIVLPAGSSRRLDDALLTRMRDVLTHRGPDGAGSFLEPGVGLGHRRLSIIDVAHGQQPMFSDDGRYSIVYNGEIYNHPHLKAELEALGDTFRTRCDTETVLRLFARMGGDAVTRLRGMFAIAIWDRDTRELFLARDRFGVKPVYYAHTSDGALYFGSEIKSLLAIPEIAAKVNMNTMPDYLANHAPSGNDTMFAGIKRLPAGHTLTWRDGEIRIDQYWDLCFAQDEGMEGTDADLIAQYGERFRDAVKMRLMSDVPLGMFLSGGIDSAAITAVMSKLVDEPIKTFSVAFQEREANELYYARLIAKRYKTDHNEILVTPDQFFGALPKLIWHEDEPIAHPSSVALYFVSKLASEKVKVVLTGEGSDETLAGYGRYRSTMYNLRFGTGYEAMTGSWMRRAIRGGILGMPARSRIRRKLSRTFLTLPARLDSLYLENFAVFRTWEQGSLLTPFARERIGDDNPYRVADDFFQSSGSLSLLNKLLYVDTKTYLQELLMKQDQMSMAASIESRVPFLDHPLVEFAAKLPQRLKLRGMTTKYVLREAMKHLLPAEILSRKKMGFPVPVGAWLRGPYTKVLDEFVLGPRPRARGLFDHGFVSQLVARHRAGEDHTERLWSLINFEIWQRMHFDKEPIEAIHVR